jgi:hypothetical protein
MKIEAQVASMWFGRISQKVYVAFMLCDLLGAVCFFLLLQMFSAHKNHRKHVVIDVDMR